MCSSLCAREAKTPSHGLSWQHPCLLFGGSISKLTPKTTRPLEWWVSQASRVFNYVEGLRIRHPLSLFVLASVTRAPSFSSFIRRLSSILPRLRVPYVGDFEHDHGERDGGCAVLLLKLTLPRSDLSRCECGLLQYFAIFEVTLFRMRSLVHFSCDAVLPYG